MNKKELIKTVANTLNETQTKTELYLNQFIEQIEKAVLRNEVVSLSRFGKFSLKTRKERNVRNPKTKELLTVPKHDYPAFTVSTVFKDKVKELQSLK